MPFSSAFENYPIIERAQRVRQSPVSAYAVVLIAVGVATGLRWAVGGRVISGVPFITYYPAIVIATLLGGFWPGVLSVILSSITAWYLFLPPVLSFDFTEKEAASLLLFIAIAGLDVIIVSLLNHAVERVLVQEQNTRVLIESAPNGIVMVDDQGTIKRVNSATEKLFGYGRSELIGMSVDMLVPIERGAAHRTLREAYLRKPEARLMGVGRDLSGRRKDGSEVPIEIGLAPVARNGNRAVLATVIDISERKRAHDVQLVLIQELTHRTANLFSMIRFVANRSLAEGQTLEKAKEDFNARLDALARAHTMLAEAAWEGAPLAEILRREVAEFSGQLSITGCDLILNASAAQQFSLIAHELLTNAVKHGAFKVPQGRVWVEGTVQRDGADGQFLFRWKETGGPSVVAPTRRGFGSVILIDVAERFGRRVTADYGPDGLTYELLLSLSAIEGGVKPSDPPVHARAS